MSFIVSRYVQNDSGTTLFDGCRYAVIQDMHGPGSPFSDRGLAEEHLLRIQKQFSVFGAFHFKFAIREVPDKPVLVVLQSRMNLGVNGNTFLPPQSSQDGKGK